MNIQQIKQRYDIVGNDAKLEMALNKAVQVAGTDLSILIAGESGVGKDVFSRIIHEGSSRKHKKLVPVNCGAIPEGTIESELFGHVKGSFTGADRDRKGYFEVADKGTIFLDEVGELPLQVQVKLLRVLENGEIMPVGASMPVKVDVRVVAATHVDLLQAVRNGHFREDLYYRLNQIAIQIPPLRERREDIPLLFRKFASDVAERYRMSPIFLNEEAKQYLMHYPWYGNIRELRNLTEQIAVVENERTITREILENYLAYVPDETMPALVGGGTRLGGAESITDRELLLRALTMGQMINEMRGEINELRQAVAHLAQGKAFASDINSSASPTSIPDSHTMLDHDVHVLHSPSHHEVPDAEDTEYFTPEVIDEDEPSVHVGADAVSEEEPLALEERERKAIQTALRRHDGNRKLAAQDLHISERTLYRKIKGYGL